ncbi:MAG: T9SS type A sorting domain-containing protein [Bacteroidota bacterium]|nr:T9SS type A sorting domain-containing protein [Bacteroidota bacterium]
MKYKLQIIAIALLMGNVAFGQVPNGSFENWTGSEANSWVSTNLLMFLGNSQSVYKSTDAHGGSFACEVNTIKVNIKPPGQPIPDYTGSIFLGRFANFNPTMGAPYTKRPDKMVFWYKYVPKGTDSAIALVTLTRWNSSTKKTDTVGLGVGPMTGSTTTYTKKDVDIMYLSNNAPDTAIVLFVSSSLSANQAGSKLTIDDADFVGGNTGIIAQTQNEIGIYPNPAKDMLNLELGNLEGNVYIAITDIQGKNIYTQIYSTCNNVTIQTSTFKSGIYILNVTSDKNTITHKIIIE